MFQKNVAVVTVCHNQLEMTKKFLESLEEACKDSTNYTLYILDNGSQDGTAEYLLEEITKKHEKKEKGLQIGCAMSSSENLGFAGGNNKLLEYILANDSDKFSGVLLINNDTLVTKEALDYLVEVAHSSNEIGATGPLSNNVGGVQKVKIQKPITDTEYKTLAGLIYKQEMKNPMEVSILMGFCLYIKMEVLKEIGLLDERFGLGMWEDNDYCLRIRNAGYRMYVCQRSLIYHYGSQTIKSFNATKLFYENKQKFLDKWKTYKYQKIVALCRVKNGGEIFHKCLTKVSSMVDTVLVFDDNSTDNTAEIAKKFANVVYYKSQWDTLNEARDRQFMLDKARELNADWCWIMDHDEMPSDRLYRELRNIVNNANPERDLFCFKIDHLWDKEDTFRTDGLWGTFWQGRLFRLRKQNVILSNDTKGDANFHCSATGFIPQQAIEFLPYTIWHYGNMDAKVRLKKYLWYTKSDKVKNLNLVMGTYKDYYTRLYALDAVNKGEIEAEPQYKLKDTDAYRHIISTLGQKVNKAEEPKISLSMIVKNEEQYIGRCLESVKDLCSEIVIVDTGSTDRTKEICKQYTNLVYDYKWNDDFAAARNFALSKCTGNWILRLDGDEELPSQHKLMIYEAVDNDDADIFIFPIRNILSINPVRQVLSKTARLFKNLPGIKFSGIVHEEIDESIQGMDLRISKLNAYIMHYGYIKNANALDKKFEFYEKLALKEIEKNPNNFKPYYNLAAHYCHLQDYDKAIQMYEKSLSLKKDSYMIWHDYATAIFQRVLEKNRKELEKVANLYQVSASLMPKGEFAEYRKRLEFNLAKVKGLLL